MRVGTQPLDASDSLLSPYTDATFRRMSYCGRPSEQGDGATPAGHPPPVTAQPGGPQMHLLAHSAANDAMCTTLPLRYPPEVLAAACVSLALRAARSPTAPRPRRPRAFPRAA